MKPDIPVTGVEKPLESDAVIISTTDNKGKITSVNHEFEEISGFDQQELMGMAHNIVRHPEVPKAAFADLWSTLKQGKSWLGIINNRCKNGDNYWVEAFVAPTFENGEISGYQSVRVKPRADDVARARSLYKRINGGQFKPRHLQNIPLAYKLVLFNLLTIVPLALSIFISQFFSEPTAVWMAGAVLSFLVGFALSYSFARPIQKIAEESKHIADNGITRLVVSGRTDEIGQIITAMRVQEAKLRTVLCRTDDASRDLSEEAEATAVAAARASVSMTQQRAEISQLAEAIEQMSATIQQVANNTQAVSNATSDVSEQSGQMNEISAKSAGTILKLENEMNNAAKVIESLYEESKNVGAVLEVIRGIAEQTNLLALNAAIEAARAGEAGRGFAVVADEVRGLATRTAESTEEIDAMVEKFQSGTHEAVKVITTAQSSATESSDHLEESAEALHKILGAMKTIDELSTQVANAVEQQSAVSGEINTSVKSIQDAMQEQTKTAEEIADTNENLNQMTQTMRNVVKQAKV